MAGLSLEVSGWPAFDCSMLIGQLQPRRKQLEETVVLGMTKWAQHLQIQHRWEQEKQEREFNGMEYLEDHEDEYGNHLPDPRRICKCSF